MHRLRLAVLAIVLAAGTLVPRARAQTIRHALLIGIDRYSYAPRVMQGWQRAAQPEILAWRSRVPGVAVAQAGSADGRAHIGDLDGAVNDAVAMATVLRSRFGFTDVRLLTDSSATRAGILSAIDALASRVHKGDVVAFYYAGHGSQRVNSLAANKLDRLDQTIVPADANAGVFDIRNTELAAAFDRLLDRGATLTLIFDSCHSGSITRGEMAPGKRRWAAADPRDARDSVRPVPPEQRGALLLAAAQDFQSAQEIRLDAFDQQPHGAFTSALLQVLRTAAVNAAAPELFARATAILKQDDRAQDPVLRGAEHDPARPLFGHEQGALSGRMTVAVQRVQRDTVYLEGGSALGFGVGTELGAVDDTGAARPEHVRITRIAGLGSSRGVVTAGRIDALHAGDLLVVSKWVNLDRPAMRVWIPAGVPGVEIEHALAAVHALRSSTALELVEDPAAVPVDSTRPLYVARRGATGWELQSPTGDVARLPSFSAPAVQQAVQAAAARGNTRPNRPRVVVVIPPVDTWRRSIVLGAGTVNAAVEVVTEPQQADYLLMGRDSAGVAEYAWARPNASDSARARSSLPVRTDWFATSRTPASAAGDSATSIALRLARLQSWLTITPPPGARPFPYHLLLRNAVTGELKSGGATHDGESYDLLLQRDPAVNPNTIPRRYVYVFAVDSHGDGVPLWEANNTIPYDSAGVVSAPVQVPLYRPAPLSITTPYGTDTFIMVSSDERLDAEVFHFSGVVTRDATRGPGGGQLATLFARASGVTRGIGDPVPTSWSIERLVTQSGPAVTSP